MGEGVRSHVNDGNLGFCWDCLDEVDWSNCLGIRCLNIVPIILLQDVHPYGSPRCFQCNDI